MKMPIKRTFAIVLVLQLVSVLLFMARQDLITRFLPTIGWAVLPITLYFMWQQRAECWQSLREVTLSPWRYVAVMTLMFGCFALFIWQVGALSLTLIYPYLNGANETPVGMVVAPRELLAWCLQGALSLWFLIACMALGINLVKHQSQFSLLKTRFKKLSSLAAYTESILLVSSLSAVYVLSMLLIFQLSKSAASWFGLTQVNIPYLGMGVFFLIMYLFNTFYHFSKRHRSEGKKASTSMAYILMRQMGFYLVAWAMSIVVTLCLPEHVRADLSEPLGFALLPPDTYASYWQLTILIWGLCCVPVLSLLVARYTSALPLLQSSALILMLPVALVWGMNSLLLHTNSFTALFNANLPYHIVTLTEPMLIFTPSFLSVTAGVSVLLLLALFKYCRELAQAWVGIMPSHSGRRVLRLKTRMAKLFGVGMMFYILYMMLGVIALAMVFVGYLLALILYMILHLGQGLAVSLSLPNRPLAWKRG